MPGLRRPGASCYAVGARGFTSGLINVFPRHSVAIHRALEKGDHARAGQLVRDMRVFEELRAPLHEKRAGHPLMKPAGRAFRPFR